MQWKMIWWCLLVATAAAQREALVYPQQYQTLSSDSKQYAANASCFTLSSSNAAVILDYGTEIGGFPQFDVHSISSPVQVEAKYSESRLALDEPFADGPWTFSNELANTFRVETFNVTEPGPVQSFFLQGGLRWQRLQLLSPESSIKICGVDMRSANDRTAVDALPGHFECSNPMYNKIWALGPRTVQQACVANNTAPSTWEVTSDGVYLRGQQPAQSVRGVSYANYTMTFLSKIIRGGTGWKVASGVGGYGPYFVLTSKYPPGATFLNTNRILVPPNTLVVGYGYNLVNQTSLTTGATEKFPLPFDIKEDKWYRLSTTINQTGYSVAIDDHPVVFVALEHLQTPTAPTGGSGSVTGGTWGFGPYQDQMAYVKDVQVLAHNGTRLYQNPMTAASVLEEYGVMPNSQSVCLDGAKRDRLIWSGDFTHTYRVISASTYRQDFLVGTLSYTLNRQATSGPYAGFFSMSPTMGQSSEYTLVYNSFGILDYQMLFLNAFAGYYLDSEMPKRPNHIRSYIRIVRAPTLLWVIRKTSLITPSLNPLKMPESIPRAQLQENEGPDEPDLTPNGPDMSKEGGYGWVCVAATFLLNAHTWGINSAYGVFLSFYLSNSIFPGTTALEYAFVGGLSISCAMLVSPIATYISQKVSTRLVLNIGTTLETLSLITTSFVTQNWQLFLSQGICFGFGMGFCFIGSVGIVSQWFDRRRSLVNGIVASGSGVGGLVYSLATGKMIPSLGFPWAVRVIGILCFSVNTISGNLLRQRSKPSKKGAAFDLSLLTRLEYILFLGWGFLSAMGYVALLFSLSSYTVAVGHTQSQGSLASALLNLGQAIGRALIGLLSDHFGRVAVPFVATFLTGLFSLVIWIFAKSLGVIYFFSVITGLFAGTLWAAAAPMGTEVVGLPDLPSALGILWLVLTPPTAVAEAIAIQLRDSQADNRPYLRVQVFIGVIYIGAALCLVPMRILLNQKRTASTD